VGLHYGQIVVIEVAVAALVTAAVAGSATGWVLAVLVAAGLLVLGFGRLRHRPLRSWCATALRYLTHARHLPASGGAGGLLGLLDPVAMLHETDLGGEPAGLIEDTGGLTAVLELGGDGCELVGVVPLPALDELLPPVTGRRAAADGTEPQPGINVQLLIAGAPAPAPRVATGVLANSYRQLSMGRVPARRRALLAVRACRDDPGWMYEDLRIPLSRAVRRIRRRLAQEQAPIRAVPPARLPAVLAELAHHDPDQPVREGWARLRTGGLHQASLLVRHWPRPETTSRRQPTAPATGAGATPDGAGTTPDGGQGQLSQLVARLLCLPATAVTIGLTVGRDGGQLVLRLAAANTAGLATAGTALRRLLGGLGMASAGLDGAQRDGLIATLPLARLRWPAREARPALALPAAGLMLGRDRHGEPVTVHLGRPEPAAAVLVGGVRAAALVAMRALALGTEVAVQTGRPQAWEPHLRAVSLPGQVPVLPPDRPLAPPPATPLAPQLVIVDVGDTPGEPSVPAAPWRTVLVVRDALTPTGAAALARADLVILQPLSAAEAALAGGALGLRVSQEWLSAIRADMVGVVNRGQVRWARLSPSPIEVQVVGVPERTALPSGVSA
jgi:type VII secretion protein EccE